MLSETFVLLLPVVDGPENVDGPARVEASNDPILQDRAVSKEPKQREQAIVVWLTCRVILCSQEPHPVN